MRAIGSLKLDFVGIKKFNGIVRKMHGALPLQHAERLIRVMAVHVILIVGIGIDMYPCVQTFTVEDGFSLSFFVGNLQQVEDFYGHSSSLFYSQRNLLRLAYPKAYYLSIQVFLI